MKEDRKELIIVSVILVTFVIVMLVMFGIGYVNSKHQQIAYEQYIAEDLRQARIYNVTFAKTEEEFLNKIENFPESDKVIAKALYDIKPEVTTLKKTLKEDLYTKEQLIAMSSSQSHDILSDSKTSLSLKGIYTIEQYVQTYNIKGYISQQEYSHLYDMFVSYGDSLQIAEFSNVVNKYGIAASSSVSTPNYSEKEKQLEDVNQRIATNENLLNKISTTYNDLIAKNSTPLEYQNTITTNGIKTAADYLISI